MRCARGAAQAVMRAGNEILDEISHVREQIAAEAGEDSQQLLDWVRAEETKTRARGVKFSQASERAEPSTVVREEPPTK